MISPRSNETEAALAVLESTVPVLDENGEPRLDSEGEPLVEPAYDDPKSMAKAIVRAVGAEISRREAYLIAVPGGSFAWGPFFTETQARRMWEKEIGPATDGAARIVRSYPWGATDQPEQTAGVCDCGHQPEQHVVKNLRGGKTSAPMDCGVCAKTVKKGAPNECAQYVRKVS